MKNRYRIFFHFYFLLSTLLSFHLLCVLCSQYKSFKRVKYNNEPKEFVRLTSRNVFFYFRLVSSIFFLALCPSSVTNATLCLPEEFADGRFRWNRAITTRTPRDKSKNSAYDERQRDEAERVYTMWSYPCLIQNSPWSYARTDICNH